MEYNTIESIFDAEGIMKHYKSDYIPRPSQIEAAGLVYKSLNQKAHVIMEGPCGFGKTFAYLVPAFLSLYENPMCTTSYGEDMKRRIVIATDGISLQEQLLYKDIPLVEKIFYNLYNKHLICTLLKGRQNFFCLAKAGELEATGAKTTEQAAVIKWAAGSTTGDFSELNFVPKYDTVTSVACTEEGECRGKRCPAYSVCFYQKHKQKALMADVIVTNYHLLFSDLKISLSSDSKTTLLPRYSSLIFDEAHKVADIYRGFMETSFSLNTIRYIRRKVTEMRKNSFINYMFSDQYKIDNVFGEEDGIADRNAKYPVSDKIESLLGVTQNLFNSIATKYLKHDKYSEVVLAGNGLHKPDFLQDVILEIESLYSSIMIIIERIERLSETKLDDPDILQTKNKLDAALRRLDENLHILKDLKSDTIKDDEVIWFDKSEDRGNDSMCERIAIKKKPVSVAQSMFDSFFGRDDLSCVLTSATLSVNGGYTYLKDELGLSLCSQSVVPKEINEFIGHSPFDLSAQELWYLPKKAVDAKLDRNSDGSNPFAEALTSITSELAVACRGGILCLTTSNKNMNLCYQAIVNAVRHHKLNIKVFKQGDMPKKKLVESFQEDRDSILVATKSFFTGIDVPGDSLRCVIIDKLPFQMQSDPVVLKRNAEDKSFFKYSIPAMIIDLKQAVGRGVRTIDDRCVIAIIDNRLSSAGYKNMIFGSFPYKMNGTREISDVEKFLHSN